MIQITQAAQKILTDWHSQKPVMALMGEFSAGKSTLVNLLLKRPLLPTQVTATQLPAVWVTYGEQDAMHGLRRDGTLDAISVDDLDDNMREKYLLLRYAVSAEILKRVDIIDAPGISDPRLKKGATEYLGQYMDFAIWCSSATQAWRQTEKKSWSSFPPKLRHKSAVLLTRADKLRRASDVTKVVNRVKRETKDLFRSVIAIDTPTATRLSTESDRDSSEWKKSGGEAFYQFLNEAIESISDRDVSDVPIHAPKSEDTISSNKPELAVDIMDLFCDLKAKCTVSDTLSDIKTRFEHLKDQISTDTKINPMQRFVLNQCLSVGEGKNLNVARVLKQIELEIVDFKADNWCTLSSDIS